MSIILKSVENIHFAQHKDDKNEERKVLSPFALCQRKWSELFQPIQSNAIIAENCAFQYDSSETFAEGKIEYGGQSLLFIVHME